MSNNTHNEQELLTNVPDIGLDKMREKKTELVLDVEDEALESRLSVLSDEERDWLIAHYRAFSAFERGF